jgi:protein-disulfide isomerase
MSRNIVLFRALGAFALLWLAVSPVLAQSLPPKEEILADRVMGDPNAPVTLEEYASLTCPHCAAFHKDTLPALKKDYVDTGKVKLVYRDYPLDRLALAATMMARCAPKERYFGLLETLMRTQESWARSQDPNAALQRLGQVAGLSKESFDACMANKDIYDGIMASRAEYDEKVKITGTPTFLLDGRKLNINPVADEFRKVIDPAIAAAQKK